MKRDQVKRLAATEYIPGSIAGLGTCCVAIRYGPRHTYLPTFRELNNVELSGQLSETTTLRAEAW